MSRFGWSADDIVSGLKVVWDIWKAISDGPMSAKIEAKQFFEEFYLITQCLDDWAERNEGLMEGSSLAEAPSELKQQCIDFISRHMQLIRMAKPSKSNVQKRYSNVVEKGYILEGSDQNSIPAGFRAFRARSSLTASYKDGAISQSSYLQIICIEPLGSPGDK